MRRSVRCWAPAITGDTSPLTCGFSAGEWATLHTLFRRAWELPDIRRAWDALAFEYGELEMTLVRGGDVPL